MIYFFGRKNCTQSVIKHAHLQQPIPRSHWIFLPQAQQQCQFFLTDLTQVYFAQLTYHPFFNAHLLLLYVVPDGLSLLSFFIQKTTKHTYNRVFITSLLILHKSNTNYVSFHFFTFLLPCLHFVIHDLSLANPLSTSQFLPLTP